MFWPVLTLYILYEVIIVNNTVPESLGEITKAHNPQKRIGVIPKCKYHREAPGSQSLGARD